MLKTTPTRYGAMTYIADDLLIGASLEKYGEYSQLEVDFLGNIIKPEWTVVDVGANIGYLTRAMATLVGPNGLVLAFEPHPEIFPLLEANALQENTKLIQCALGKSIGMLSAPLLSTVAHKNYGNIELSEAEQTVLSTQVARLDEWGGYFNLIKIDVEGMELDVLAGAGNLIKRCLPVLIVEFVKTDKDRLRGTLEAGDYGVFEFGMNFVAVHKSDKTINHVRVNQ